MIIQIRGTSGSGKSTAMRQVMSSIGSWEKEYVAKRKQPLYYRSTYVGKSVIVLGHYESPCGGCDTIGSAKAVYELLQTIQADVILCEGLLLSEDVKWSSQLKDLVVMFLTTTPETCIEQIKQRRASVGNEKELNTSNTLNRVPVIERARRKLVELGIDCVRTSGKQCPGIVLNRMRLHAHKEY
jgi:gluconate kinase